MTSERSWEREGGATQRGSEGASSFYRSLRNYEEGLNSERSLWHMLRWVFVFVSVSFSSLTQSSPPVFTSVGEAYVYSVSWTEWSPVVGNELVLGLQRCIASLGDRFVSTRRGRKKIFPILNGFSSTQYKHCDRQQHHQQKYMYIYTSSLLRHPFHRIMLFQWYLLWSNFLFLVKGSGGGECSYPHLRVGMSSLFFLFKWIDVYLHLCVHERLIYKNLYWSSSK